MEFTINVIVPIVCTGMMCISNYIQTKNYRKENDLFRSVIQKNTEAIMMLEVIVDEKGEEE